LHTWNVGLVFGARDAALSRRSVTVMTLDAGAVAGLVTVRAVGTRLWFLSGRPRLNSTWNELVTRGTALATEI